MISALLQHHVDRGAIAGAVALVEHDRVEVAVAGLQDLAAGRPMQRDTIFRTLSMTKPITAAATMLLVEDGRLRLEDPVERWLPELADRRVLRTAESALDDTVPARRAAVVEDLLTLRLGLGWLKSGAVAAEMQALGVAPGPEPLPFPPDEFMARIGRLPLAAQPGERWLYHTGADILAVLIARVAGQPLPDLLQERLFEPLGMADTGFYVPSAKLDRLATAYARAADGSLAVSDPAAGGDYAAPPAFPSELVSTIDDYHRFARMLLDQGAGLLSPASVGRMMQDHITAAQKAVSPFFPGFWDRNGWGYGGAVVTQGLAGGPATGSYGWDGGYGTSMTIDRATGRIVILLLQRLMTGPDDSDVAAALRDIAYQNEEGKDP